jgi:hypothetical protein
MIKLVRCGFSLDDTNAAFEHAAHADRFKLTAIRP